MDLFTLNFAQLGPDLTAQWNGIVDIFRGALNILNGITGGALDAILHLFGTSIDQINAKAADMNKNVSGSASTMNKNVVASLTDMKNKGLEQTSQLTWQAQGMFADMGTQVGIDMSNMDVDTKNYWNDIADYINNHPLNVPLHNQKSQHYAEGTDYAPGGLSVVGERGPELVYLPRGARVIPNNQISNHISMTAGGGSKQPVHIHVDVGSKELASVLVDDIMELAARQTRQRYGRRVY